MAKFIHVISATKVPENRGSNTNPFEDFPSNPNDDVTFGPSQRTMFLSVDEPAAPVVNPILEQVTPTYTPDVNGVNVRGVYVSGEDLWRFTWTTSAQELETARSIKHLELEQNESDAVAVGYTVGQFVFPYTEEFFRLLADRHYWLDIAITDGEVPANTQITFSDRTEKEVSVGLTTLRNNFRTFGKEYLIIQETSVASFDRLEAASTLTEIDAIVWEL